MKIIAIKCSTYKYAKVENNRLGLMEWTSVNVWKCKA